MIEPVLRVVILGGTGFIGTAIAARLGQLPDVHTTIAARRNNAMAGADFVRLDATDPRALSQALERADVVVNCVTGSGRAIRASAHAIVQAALHGEARPSIIHMSSQSVYGSQEGQVDETAALGGGANWYGKAKIEAESILGTYGHYGGCCSMLRIGCPAGPGSTLWVDRIGSLLRQGRLGDLAEFGDGWSNLVHVNDVANAVAGLVGKAPVGHRVYNIAAPDSPRWNHYFRDLALAMDLVPLRYKTRLAMSLEAWLVAPPLKVAERVGGKPLVEKLALESVPPSLLRLWAQQIRLDSRKVEDALDLTWTPYSDLLNDSVAYLKDRQRF